MPRLPRIRKRCQRTVPHAPGFFCYCILFFSVLCSSFSAFAFQNKVVSEQYEVNEITFKIDGTTSKDVYRDLIQTVETPARFWTFLYNSVYKNIGSKPVYFDPVLFEGDIMRL